MEQVWLQQVEFNLNNNIMYNSFKYAIINSSEKPNVDYTKLVSMGRENNDKSKCVAKYVGKQPSSLNNALEYTHQEILEELKKEEWVTPVSAKVQEFLDGL